ncbi:uncharacterized protein TNCV_4979601 [Trichonephila clavipes]|nr:uncharacterized protein TNCV_4979601 [Trichonephila clavipes]
MFNCDSLTNRFFEHIKFLKLTSYGTVGRNFRYALPVTVSGKRKTVLETKREEFVDEALIYAKSLCEELEISFEPPRRIRRKHIFGDGSKDVQLSFEDDLKRTMFSSIDRVTAEIRERLQNLAQKYALLGLK